MRITCIFPPNPVLSEPTMQPPLGLLYLAAVLEEAGHEVKIADLRDVEILDVRRIPEADYYLITATTGEIDCAKNIAKHIRRHRGLESPIVVGGAHASTLPESCTPFFDAVCVGEGEKAILEIVENEARGVVNSEPIKNLDTIPFPARHLLAEDRIFSRTLFPGSKYGIGPKATSLISSRGCPYNCAFCANIPQPVRFRSAENFVSEIKHLVDCYGCYHFRMVDDNFTLSWTRLSKICELLEPLKVHYRCHTRSQLLDKEICKMMKASGCEEIGLGVETADDEILKLINKKETVEDHKRAIRLIKEAGMRAKVFWMIGLPGYSDETVEKNKEFMRECKPAKYTLNIFVPYPGCDIAKNPEKYGVKIVDRNYKHYWNFPDYPVHELENADRNTIYGWYKDFYNFLRSEEWKK